jgi:hypothetical protein
VGGSLITPPTRERPQSCGERLDVSPVCPRGDAALGTGADSDGRRRFGVTLRGYVGALPGATEGADMAAEQGMGTGRVPGLNTERVYSTTVPAEELARALADHFRAQGFEAQVFRTSRDRPVMQARKESRCATCWGRLRANG